MLEVFPKFSDLDLVNFTAHFKPLAVIGGDHHLNVWRQFNATMNDGIPFRVRVGIDVLEQGCAWAQRFQCPWIINGDLTHDKNALNPFVTHALVEFFHHKVPDALKVWLNVGNHEATTKNAGVNTLSWLKNFVNNVASEPTVVASDDAVFHFMPFMAEYKDAARQMSDFSLEMAKTDTRPRVLLAHYPTNGVDLGGHILESEVELDDFNPDAYAACLFSDIHKHQPCSHNSYHLGITHQNNFGETGYEYGWWLLGQKRNNGQPMANRLGLFRLPVRAPEFFLCNSEDEVKRATDAGHFAKLRPEKVISAALKNQHQPRLSINTADMPSTISNYLGFRIRNNGLDPLLSERIQQEALQMLGLNIPDGAR